MKQRMLLARALINKPKILFLDEPTSGLDPTTSRTIHELLNSLKEEGTTIFLTTHDMNEATLLCDTVALLSKGKLVEMGSPETIIQKYNQDKLVKVTYTDGSEKIVSFNELSQLVDETQENLVTIHSCEPTLEDIFIELTGEDLMFRQFLALLWLRTQIIITNKSVLLQMVMPAGLVYLYKFMMDSQSGSKEQLGIVYLMLCIPFALVLAVGGPILTILAEEKEKNNLKTLLLSGVKGSEYLLSTLIIPLILSVFYLVVTPLILGVNIDNYTNYYVISGELR